MSVADNPMEETRGVDFTSAENISLASRFATDATKRKTPTFQRKIIHYGLDTSWMIRVGRNGDTKTQKKFADLRS